MTRVLRSPHAPNHEGALDDWVLPLSFPQRVRTSLLVGCRMERASMDDPNGLLIRIRILGAAFGMTLQNMFAEICDGKGKHRVMQQLSVTRRI